MLPAVAAQSPERTENKQDLPELHVACLYGELISIQNLVEAKQWWINSSDSQGHRPLHMVLFFGASPNTSACLRYLLEHEADVNATTHSGQTPLHLAASKGLLRCVEMLVKAGADLMKKDSMGHTPLDLARIWCHRKVARYLKSCLWHADKKREMEERKLVQALYGDLVNTAKQKNNDKKTLTDEKMAEWANKKGLPLLKDFSSRVQRVSQYHAQCLLPDQTSYKPKQSKSLCKRKPDDPQEVRSTQLKQPAALSTSPWSIFMGLQPEKPPAELDLRDSVTLWKDTNSRQLQYSTKWDDMPHSIPKLPLDVVERVLFPRAFPSRIATLQQFEPQNIDKVQHLGCPQGRRTSPWTEMAMHLAEMLEPGHY
ncbi:ankyrin repeat domain-containing protein 53 isoform X2 [Melanotaenia boesemani]|nr:ankyrin repeat domain-containing protein 53 isoform X2 [Melanotaenia boesemani]XP_041840909.1 ankyrin repeat domain-containing protein 53 isoform X2 [Melanotaenia boesemani]